MVGSSFSHTDFLTVSRMEMEHSDFRRTIDSPGYEREPYAAVQVHPAFAYMIPSMCEGGCQAGNAHSAIYAGIRKYDLPAVNVAGQHKINACL